MFGTKKGAAAAKPSAAKSPMKKAGGLFGAKTPAAVATSKPPVIETPTPVASESEEDDDEGDHDRDDDSETDTDATGETDATEESSDETEEEEQKNKDSAPKPKPPAKQVGGLFGVKKGSAATAKQASPEKKGGGDSSPQGGGKGGFAAKSKTGIFAVKAAQLNKVKYKVSNNRPRASNM